MIIRSTTVAIGALTAIGFTATALASPTHYGSARQLSSADRVSVSANQTGAIVERAVTNNGSAQRLVFDTTNSGKVERRADGRDANKALSTEDGKTDPRFKSFHRRNALWR